MSPFEFQALKKELSDSQAALQERGRQPVRASSGPPSSEALLDRKNRQRSTRKRYRRRKAHAVQFGFLQWVATTLTEQGCRDCSSHEEDNLHFYRGEGLEPRPVITTTRACCRAAIRRCYKAGLYTILCVPCHAALLQDERYLHPPSVVKKRWRRPKQSVEQTPSLTDPPIAIVPLTVLEAYQKFLKEGSSSLC